MQHSDDIVVAAGQAGLVAAAEMADRGLQVVMSVTAEFIWNFGTASAT